MSKLSPPIVLAWKIAAAEAIRLQHQFIEPEHLFIGICSLEKFTNFDNLDQLHIDQNDLQLTKRHIDSLLELSAGLGLEFNTLRRNLRHRLATLLPKATLHKGQTVHRSEKSQQIFALAERAARESGALHTTIFHLFLALLDDRENSLPTWLHESKINLDELKAALSLAVVESLETLNGSIVSQLISNEFEPPHGISEEEFADIHLRIIKIGTQSQGQALLERCLDEVSRMFPQADQCALLLIEESGEPVVRAGWPVINSKVSFTLVDKVVHSQTALHWVEGVDEYIESVYDTAAALYAPIIYGRQVLGVLQVGIAANNNDPFAESDLRRLSVAANTIGLAIQAGAGVKSNLRRYPWVFLSYAHKDRDAARRLARDLRRRRIKVWIDEQLPAAEEWRKQLAIAIEQTDALLLVLSPESIISKYVLWEIETARSANKKIFPIYYKTCDIPSELASLQYIDFRFDYDKGLHHLTQALDKLPYHQRD